jgi:DNA-binding response OmpR family regulator
VVVNGSGGQLGRGCEAVDRRPQSRGELRQAERLDQVRDRPKLLGLSGIGVDAGADDRELGASPEEPHRRRERFRMRGLEEKHVHVGLAGSLASPAGREDRLVSETLDDVREQRPHLGMRFVDKDPHRFKIERERADCGGIWYGTGMKRGHVLVIDDDPDIRSLVKELLERQGYGVTEAANGKEALRALYATSPDVVLLDVSMPDLDGWQTLERIRDLSDVPVAMLTARAAELEKVRGLKAGADDYITKPFGRQELLARVEAMLRRAGPREETKRTYADALLSVDFAQRSASVNGSEVALTPLEFRLLAAFVRHPGQLLSHDQVLELVWGDSFSASRDQVKLYVGYLRRKLEGAGADASVIETVRGFGYRYRPSAA